MSTKEIRAYYESTKNSSVRPDLVFAVSQISGERIAVDCGCGAGSDIYFLRENDFTVHAFDIEQDSISLCTERFKGDSKVVLSQASFNSYLFPKASLVVADASLFFCPPSDFNEVWKSIGRSLSDSGGIFCGSFLGMNDTMAGAAFDKNAFWPEVMIFKEEELREIFRDYEILQWTEYDASGETAQGVAHHWHNYSVVAQHSSD